MIIKLKAGLGNIMFQYALARMFQIEYGVSDVKFDTSYFKHPDYEKYLEHFNELNVNYVSASSKQLNEILILGRLGNPQPYTAKYRIKIFLEKTINKKYYFERNRDFVEPKLLLKYDYIDGYWQSWRYVEKIRDKLRQEFSFKKKFGSNFEALKTEIEQCNSVALCVRKGDYLSTRHTKAHFYSCTPEYYSSAVEHLSKLIPNLVFYVFTNDNDWVKNNLHIDSNNTKIVFREQKELFPDYAELQLMSSCKHGIISNSTFHWWAAWLMGNENKIIIAPHLWFADGKPIDIIPREWIVFNGKGIII